MKVEIEEPDRRYATRLVDLRPGQMAVTEDGNVFLRTPYTAACLSNVNDSFSKVGTETPCLVRVLPPGTVLKLTVEDV